MFYLKAYMLCFMPTRTLIWKKNPSFKTLSLFLSIDPLNSKWLCDIRLSKVVLLQHTHFTVSLNKNKYVLLKLDLFITKTFHLVHWNSVTFIYVLICLESWINILTPVYTLNHIIHPDWYPYFICKYRIILFDEWVAK